MEISDSNLSRLADPQDGQGTVPPPGLYFDGEQAKWVAVYHLWRVLEMNWLP
jgi:hypothetical protein